MGPLPVPVHTVLRPVTFVRALLSFHIPYFSLSCFRSGARALRLVSLVRSRERPRCKPDLAWRGRHGGEGLATSVSTDSSGKSFEARISSMPATDCQGDVVPSGVS